MRDFLHRLEQSEVTTAKPCPYHLKSQFPQGWEVHGKFSSSFSAVDLDTLSQAGEAGLCSAVQNHIFR